MRSLFLLLLFAAGLSHAACPDPLPVDTVCLEWTAPTQNVNGSPLIDLAGFAVYWGLASRNYQGQIDIPDATQTEFTTPATPISIPNPGPAGGDVEVYFAMTAYDDDSNESAFSNEVLKVVAFPDTEDPDVPALLNVIINVDTS